MKEPWIQQLKVIYDIRFSYEELVKVISITDYLVAKLRARAITRRTDEQCTTVSPYAD